MTTDARRGTASSNRLVGILETLQLSDFQKNVLRQRWLEQASWASRQARRARLRYYTLRIPVVVGGVAIPGILSLTLGAAAEGIVDFRLPLFVISLTVAVFAALEELFQFGERWRHYRRTAERLKSFGWQFIELNGPYRRFDTHAEAFHAFTGTVEDILNEDVEGYLGQVVTDSPRRDRHEVVT